MEEETDKTKVLAPVANEYGSPYVRISKMGLVIGVEYACGTTNEEPVSREFYDAWVKEFRDNEENA